MGLEWEGCCPAKPWHHGGVDSRRYIPFDLVVMSQARRPADRMLWRDGQIICSSGVRIDSPLAAVAREMQLSCECKRYRPKRGAARVQYARESGLPQHWSGKKRRYSDARARRCSRVQEEEGGDAEAAQGVRVVPNRYGLKEGLVSGRMSSRNRCLFGQRAAFRRPVRSGGGLNDKACATRPGSRLTCDSTRVTARTQDKPATI